MNKNKSSTGLEPNIGGFLSYLFGWLTGLIFLFLEKENKYIRFHALQSIFVFGTLNILYVLITVFQGIVISIAWGITGEELIIGAITGIFGLFIFLINVASLALWITLMIKAYKNETFEIPVAGEIAKKQVGW